ncbi:MAG TPA: 2Fe-2S iron-sulfur cluster-binding protein [Acidisarcina sp.]|nr:2Fe-2S iron-sulfur cluster-binding protein [Acidisarcina sp.]
MSDTDTHAITRRGFLKAAGATAASTVVESAHAITKDLKDSANSPSAVGPGAVPIVLHVNGVPHSISVEPRMTLAEALRDSLGLTGTKVVCDRGSCSACTVWLDKVPTLSCMTLAIDVGTRKVTTIEGIGNPEHLHPVQAAFVKHDAMQCGFCTPGMVMSCTALLERNPNPSLDDVKQAVSGNLCRCGTYPKVFAATLEAAQERHALTQPVSASDGKGA